MAGTPIKNEKKRLIREAILRELEGDGDPVVYLLPYANKLKKMALEGAIDSAVTLGAMKEIFDRIDGKTAQEIHVEKSGERVVDQALLGFASDLLKRLPEGRKEVLTLEHEPVRDKGDGS